MDERTHMLDLRRFWPHVDVQEPDMCWEWTGRRDRHGYGEHRRRVSGSAFYWRAHRVAYEALVGPIPPGLVIDHLCRNRACCNPSHMEPVTAVENTRRGEPGRRCASDPRAWIEDAIERYPAESLAELAVRYGVHRQTVRNHLAAAGVAIRDRGRQRAE